MASRRLVPFCRGSIDSSCRTMYRTCSLPFFAGMRRAEERAGAYIHQQHHRQLTLFLEQLAERMVKPCRDIPVDEPDVISRSIFPHFPEAHTTSFKGAVILSRE